MRIVVNLTNLISYKRLQVANLHSPLIPKIVLISFII